MTCRHFLAKGLFVGILYLPLAVGSLAEPTGQQLYGATIVGTVIDSASGNPIQGVRVTRIELAGTGRQVETISDDRGRFAFTGVESGRWRVVGELTGYESGANDRRRRNGPDRPVVVSAGSHETVVIRMFPSFGHLCGVAVDDVNQPAVGINVNAVVFLDANAGDRSYAMSSGASTDDAGRFCIRLLPGSYSVVISPVTVITLRGDKVPRAIQPSVLVQQRVQRPSVPQLRIDDFDVFLGSQLRAGMLPPTTSSARLDSVYDLVLHPSQVDRSSHTVVGGQTTAVGDVSLRRAPARVVAGRLAGPSGAVPYADVRVVPRAFASSPEGTLDIAATTTDSDGSFTMFGIPPGQFIIRATATGSDGTLWAETQLAVGASDVREVGVDLRPGVRASGRVVFQGAAVMPELLARVSIGLVPVDTQVRGAAPSRPAADGTFRTADYPPGRYLLNVTAPSGWVLESAIHQRQNIALIPVTLQRDDSIDVVVTLTDQPAALTGHVRSPTGVPDPGATVLLFPAQYHFRSSSGSPAPLFREARVAADGSYEFRTVAPAEYFVIAIDDAAAEGWRRADTVPRLAAAAERVRLGVGDQLARELRTQAVGRGR